MDGFLCMILSLTIALTCYLLKLFLAHYGDAIAVLFSQNDD